MTSHPIKINEEHEYSSQQKKNKIYVYSKKIFGRKHKKLIKEVAQVEGWMKRKPLSGKHFPIVLVFRHPCFEKPGREG